MKHRRFVALVAALTSGAALALMLVAPASAANWNFETLDGNCSPGPDCVDGRTSDGVGTKARSVAWNGLPHVWYFDNTVGSLRHAWWTGSAWRFETLDGAGTTAGNGRVQRTVGDDIAVTIWNNQPHVFYYDQAAGDLRHGWWSGSAWFFETLDGEGGTNGRTANDVGMFTATAVWNGTPHVWYRDRSAAPDGENLRHAWWTGSVWKFEVLDGNGGNGGRTTDNVGLFNSVVIWNNQPHVFYRDDSNAWLRHGWWTGSTWKFEALDGNCVSSLCADGSSNHSVGEHVAATIWGGVPHIWYLDSAFFDLRHAWWTGSAWRFETLDGAGGGNGRVNAIVGGYGAVTVWNNQPHVWYADYSAGDLRHAWWSGAAWFFETLDGEVGANGRISSDLGMHNTVSVWNGQPHVWYADRTSYDLRHGWYG